MKSNLILTYDSPTIMILSLTKKGLEEMNKANDGELNWFLDEIEDVILGNEINEGFTHYLIDNDRQVFEFDENDMVTLKESSFISYPSLALTSIGTIEEVADMNNPNHIDFIEWFDGELKQS